MNFCYCTCSVERRLDSEKEIFDERTNDEGIFFLTAVLPELLGLFTNFFWTGVVEADSLLAIVDF